MGGIEVTFKSLLILHVTNNTHTQHVSVIYSSVLAQVGHEGVQAIAHAHLIHLELKVLGDFDSDFLITVNASAASAA